MDVVVHIIIIGAKEIAGRDAHKVDWKDVDKGAEADSDRTSDAHATAWARAWDLKKRFALSKRTMVCGGCV